MTAPPFLLDACVLANFSVTDTLLRLAEPPRLFQPKWSEDIILETTRTLELKLAWPKRLVENLEMELRKNFSGAWVSDYQWLIAAMTNHEKDRHVAAAAVQCQAEAIITFNLRHFGSQHLHNWGVSAIHPQSFLVNLLRQNPDLMKNKLERQASDRNRTLPELLQILASTVPEFVTEISKSLSK